MNLISSVGDRVRGVGLDTAAASTISNTDSDVTLVTPSGVPGVLDHIELLTVLSTITNGENSVVVRSTATSANNTRAVVLEDRVVSLNGDSNGLLGDGSLELRGAIGSNSLVRGDRDFTLGG